LEPQRSNLVTFSENLDNAAWTKTEVTVSANAAISPDGYANSDKIVPSINNAAHFFLQNSSVTSGTAYTMSLFAKADGYSFLQIANSGGFSVASRANFDLSNGTVGSNDAGTATITNYGNGWYRLSYTLTADSTTSAGRFVVAVVNSGTAARLAGFVADGTSGVLIYGCQFEASAYASSYIPTLGASVTRVADACSKTGISSLIGQTEGTIYAEVDLRNFVSGSRIFAIGDGSTSNRVVLLLNTSSRIRAIISSLSTLQAEINTATLVSGTYKVALAYALNDIALYVNGVQIGTDTSATIPACPNVYLGTSEFGTTDQLADRITQALLFKTRLTNSELSQLTTL
jgi:hypothetical protein